MRDRDTSPNFDRIAVCATGAAYKDDDHVDQMHRQSAGVRIHKVPNFTEYIVSTSETRKLISQWYGRYMPYSSWSHQ